MSNNTEKGCMTCIRCGRVAFGVTREWAEGQVRRFNEFFDSASEAVREGYGGRRSSIAEYERCRWCGGQHANFRPAVEGDAPVGVTMSPIIVDD